MKLRYIKPQLNFIFVFQDIVAASPKDVDTTLFNPSWLDQFFQGGAN